MSFAIRAMQLADLDDVLAVAAGSTEAPQWPRAAYEPYVAPDSASSALVRSGLVVLDRGQSRSGAVAGFACGTLVLDGVQNLCQLDSMAVQPDQRRRGMGGALLSGMLAWAGKNGARQFSLEVRASNLAAIALYTRFGLGVEGRRPGYYAHPEEDALILGKVVTSGDSSLVFHQEIG